MNCRVPHKRLYGSGKRGPACFFGLAARSSRKRAHEFRDRSWQGEGIRLARNAAHTFEAYTSFKSIFKNQKRQVIGQTLVHLLVDDYLKHLPPWERTKLADTLRRKDQENPNWLKELIGEHIRRKKFFWRLYPGLLTHRFRHLARLNWFGKIAHLPVVFAGFLISIPSSIAAFRFLKSGCTNYWPQAERGSFKHFELRGGNIAPLGGLKHQE